jgi:chromate transport protein ChrA
VAKFLQIFHTSNLSPTPHYYSNVFESVVPAVAVVAVEVAFNVCDSVVSAVAAVSVVVAFSVTIHFHSRANVKLVLLQMVGMQRLAQPIYK